MTPSNAHNPGERLGDRLADWLPAWRTELAARRRRGIVWIAADDPLPRAQALMAASDWASPLWIGAVSQAPTQSITCLAPGRARSRLGQEHDLVVFDATGQSGFDPDAFGAISGTLVAGGCLVLLTPAAWAAPSAGDWLGDADYRRLAHWPLEAGEIEARYLARLARRLGAFEALVTWPADAARPSLPAPPGAEWASAGSDREDAPSHADIDDVDDADCLSADQAAAVGRLTRLRRRRPLVLIADRGRGKSAALGIAAARRLMAGERRLWIAASSEAAVAPLFERLGALLPTGQRVPGGFTLTLKGTESHERECRIEWLAPERVASALDDPDIDRRSPPTLFVDEAASIPAARLADWLVRFPRIAFATTVHGYEGTGRGFEVRLRDTLDRLTPDWRRLRLTTPIRWAADDPLERLTRELLCLDAEIDESPFAGAESRELDGLTLNWLTLDWLDRTALAHDEAALREAFGLLVQAHYRTTPADLRQLLDGPGVRLLAARCEGRLAGLCVVQAEGGFDAALAGAIQRGERRPRGHLLAQSLAMHAGHAEAATRRWWRIMRIAVHPGCRRRGIGQTLIEAVADAAVGQGIDHLGVSFGAEPGLMRFWRDRGFTSLRAGLTREAASGEPALMMGRGLAPQAVAEIATWAADFQTLLADLLAGELNDIEPEVAAGWLHEGQRPAWPAALTARLEAFAAGGGELALIRPWLRQAWLCWWRQQPITALPDGLGAPTPAAGSTDEPFERVPAAAAVAALFQHRDMALGPGDGAAGRRDRQAAARSLAHGLLAWQRGATGH
ncbi:tRNA(Met) cytidine acetyltransferase TmcA [Salinicola halophilus]|uniref:tRNA(Met) cytidine acetyltransferase TmcA n=1 Tax=Salinicola halophilus TaxID=184065 RepID=UPI001EF96348|nr:GNAT family N-acetyltransferase [Salinicola halophilus]